MSSSSILSFFRWKKYKNEKQNRRRTAQVFRERRQQLLLHGSDARKVTQGIKQNGNCTKQIERKKRKRSHNLVADDVIANVLSWLPVKSLIRFRCVCKSWCTLTDNPYFQNQQHKRSATAKRTSIIANDFAENYAPFTMGMYHLRIECKKLLQDCSFELITHPKEDRDVKKDYRMWNSVNGLMCLYDDGEEDECYLMNPSTREVEKLPKSRCWNDGFIMCLGLGFDSSIGVYKAVRILERSYLYAYQIFAYEILTLGDASQQWRFIREIPCFMDGDTELVFVNKAIHWLAFEFNHARGRLSRHMKIFTIDIKNENYGTISTPVPCSNFHSRVVIQDDFEGHLLFLKHTEYPKHQVRIWVMKDYASRQWTNTYNVNMHTFTRSLMLVGIAYDNIIFSLSTRVSKMWVGNIYAYDLRRKTCQKDYWRIFTESAVFYTESLVSPRKVLSTTVGTRCNVS